MAESSRRTTLVIVVIALLALLALFMVKCGQVEKNVMTGPASPLGVVGEARKTEAPPVPQIAAAEAPEVLTPATVKAPAEIVAGSTFQVSWTGPNNKNDFVTIVAKDAPENAYTNYRETHEGPTLELLATIEPGEFEVRYVAAHAKKVLGRAPIIILPAPATLDAPAEVVLGSKITVKWTGPNNKEDYITIVAKDTADGKYDNFAYTAKGSPVVVTVPVTAGDAELRYMTGQGAKVLARRTIKIKSPDISIDAPRQVVAGVLVRVAWSGPNNEGDYITVVPKETPDGKYGNYTYTRDGASLQILVPIISGEAELRYMTSQGAKVLARRPITVVAATVSLSAPDRVVAGAELSVKWVGPNNGGDYLTLVPKTLPDDRYGNYTYTNKGSPLTVVAPKEPGEAEVRYMAGQGNKLLARRAVTITAP